MSSEGIRLLALDGGGVRGLSSLMILERLMLEINCDDPPKPCEYFNMIGGTSTGGLIAIMLGRLEMTVEECITHYTALWAKVFEKTKHRVSMTGKIRGRFNSVALEQAIKDILKSRNLDEDTLLKDPRKDACKVFVCAKSKNDLSSTVCLTSYAPPRSTHYLLNSTKIWQACRATSAATSFFDPVPIGQRKEEFVDGGLGANNPVNILWSQARDLWGHDDLQIGLRCLISVGTGVPDLKPWEDNIASIHNSLINLATDTRNTAEQFHRDHADLGERYYRFNVDGGLEKIGLQEYKEAGTIETLTRVYVESQGVYMQMKKCAGKLTEIHNCSRFRTSFSLQGVPASDNFVDRPLEMDKLEICLLPRRRNSSPARRSIFVLVGLGGIGKTQLAIEFARRHKQTFSSVFWLDGRSEDQLKQSIVSCARRVPEGQIPERSRKRVLDREDNVDTVVADVLEWLAQPDNTEWLLVFDNVDQDYEEGTDTGAYDVQRYFPGDHGAILITTRLQKLAQLGDSNKLTKVDETLAKAILQKWYGRELVAEDQELIALLDGLPLALAQAGSYLRETNLDVSSYIDLYRQEWNGLMDSDSSLLDYGRSIASTWTVSFKAIKAKSTNATNLLSLWSLLDNKDLWHGLLQAARSEDETWTPQWPQWLQELAQSKVKFSEAVGLLLRYSLIEGQEQAQGCYAMHPVVHQWTLHMLNAHQKSEFSWLAVMIIGLSVPDILVKNHLVLQRRLLWHAERCSRWIREDEEKFYKMETRATSIVRSRALHRFGDLYQEQGMFTEAEEMYQRALVIKERSLGAHHPATLDTVRNLGALYDQQGKLKEAQEMCLRSLEGNTNHPSRGPEHESTLQAVNILGNLYKDQGMFEKAEAMYLQAHTGFSNKVGPVHPWTLNTILNLGLLYFAQGELDKAEKMYFLALEGNEKEYGPDHVSTLSTAHALGILYSIQGRHKHEEAERMFLKALQGLEGALRPIELSEIANNLGALYMNQGKRKEAESMFLRALEGFEKLLGPDNDRSQLVRLNLCDLREMKDPPSDPTQASAPEPAPDSPQTNARPEDSNWLIRWKEITGWLLGS